MMINISKKKDKEFKNSLIVITKQQINKIYLIKSLEDIIGYYKQSNQKMNFKDYWVSLGHKRDTYRNKIIAKYFGLIYPDNIEDKKNSLTPVGEIFLKNISEKEKLSKIIERQKTKLVFNIGNIKNKNLLNKGLLYKEILFENLLRFLIHCEEEGFSLSVDEYKYFMIISERGKIRDLFEEFKDYKKNVGISLKEWFESKIGIEKTKILIGKVKNIRHHQLWEDSDYIEEVDNGSFKLKDINAAKLYISNIDESDYDRRLQILWGEDKKSILELNSILSSNSEYVDKSNFKKSSSISEINIEDIDDYSIQKRRNQQSYTNEKRSDVDEKNRNKIATESSREFEDHVYKVLIEEYPESFFEKTYLVDTNAGYDIKEKNSLGEVKTFFEVKNVNKINFRMSDKEIRVANNNPDKYFIVFYDNGFIKKVKWAIISPNLEMKPLTYNVALRKSDKE